MSFPGRLSWVVLRKQVPIFYAEEKDQEDEIMAKASKDWGDIEDGSWMLDQFSLDFHLVQPPELSTLSLRAKAESREYGGITCLLESVMENFLVMALLFGNSLYWLVYDAAKNSLSLLPATMDSVLALEDDKSLLPLRQPAVLPRDDGSCDLLDVGLCFDGPGEVLPRSCILFRWSNRGPGKTWTKQQARVIPHAPLTLTAQCPVSHIYQADVVFTFNGKVFWVDLEIGAIVSTGTTTEDGELDFIQLPHECQGSDFSRSYPNERRTMGPVGNSIKLISIVTTNGDNPGNNTDPADVMLRSWTLSPDLRSWTRDDDMELPLPLLWASEAYKRERLPQAMPRNPVLKADEDGVLYLLLGDYYVDLDTMVRLCREIECVISINMHTKSLLSRSHRPIKDGLPPMWRQDRDQPSKGFRPNMPSLFAAKFCPSHTGWSESDGLLPKKKRNHLIDGNLNLNLLLPLLLLLLLGVICAHYARLMTSVG
ncbi:uncharacterized protein [Aegilops tauschii subsp. strangulata]|uniref:Uncharacterized protein n=1 Tax=Aegilops tauschii TaxID=37682 RepID=M8BNH3_AEGTA|nr:uncharacterized protein LOC109744692 [Aegilops tauschii subsp. strangulata]